MDGLMHRDPRPTGAGTPPRAPAGEAINPQDAMAATGGALGEPEAASPEEQRIYNQFVANAMMVMYDERTFPRLLKMLEGGGDPVEGLARATVQLVARTATSAKEKKVPINGDIVFNAGTEIFNQLADVAHEAGIAPFQEDRDMLEAAYFRALDQTRMLLQESGELDQQAAQKDLERLQAASESGELEQFLLRMAENDPRMRPENDDEPVQPGAPMENEGERPRGEKPKKKPRRDDGDGLMAA